MVIYPFMHIVLKLNKSHYFQLINKFIIIYPIYNVTLLSN